MVFRKILINFSYIPWLGCAGTGSWTQIPTGQSASGDLTTIYSIIFDCSIIDEVKNLKKYLIPKHLIKNYFYFNSAETRAIVTQTIGY
jgi:hypothetical protein